MKKLPIAIIATTLSTASFADQMPIRFGGQFRVRAEATDVQSYATAAQRRKQDLVLYRTRLHASAEPAENISAFVQIQDSRTSGQSAPNANSSNLDLFQGYVDFKRLYGLPLHLRAGRWSMQYGDQRLISPLDWSNVGRSWDGARLRVDGDQWFADAFATVISEVSDAGHDSLFYGVYSTCKCVKNHEFDLYALFRDFGNNTQTAESGTKGNLAERTVGSRFKFKNARYDYSAEAAWQFGRRAGDTIRAWAAATTAGVNTELPLSPRFAAEYAFASGDPNPGDGRLNTFNPIFPFGHFYHGHADQWLWSNGHDINAKLRIEPVNGLKVWFVFHHFMLARSADAWYNAGGAAVARDATGNSGRTVGNELDVYFKTTLRGVVKIWAGHSHFFANGFAKNTIAAKDRGFTFVQAVVGF